MKRYFAAASLADSNSVLERLRGGIPSAIQKAGEALYDLDAVTLLGQSPANKALGLVDDDVEKQVVSLDWGGRSRRTTIDADCTCGKAQPWRGCAHIWATLIATSRSKRAIQFPGRGLLYLHCSSLEILKDDLLQLFAEEGPPQAEEPSSQAKAATSLGSKKPKTARAPADTSDWRRKLDRLAPEKAPRKPPKRRQLFYHLGNFDRYFDSREIEFYTRTELNNGSLGVLKSFSLDIREIGDLPATEQALLRRLVRAQRDSWSATRCDSFNSHKLDIRLEVLASFLPALAATGRFGTVAKPSEGSRTFEPFTFDQSGPWRLLFAGREQKGNLSLVPLLRRGDEELAIDKVEPLSGNVLLMDRQLAYLDESSTAPWLVALRMAPPIVVPREEIPEALSRLGEGGYPPVELDQAWRDLIDEIPPLPALRLTLEAGNEIRLRLLFVYGQAETPLHDPSEMLLDPASGRPCRRQRRLEEQFAARLPFPLDQEGSAVQSYEQLAPLIAELSAEGWLIGTAEHKVRAGGHFRASLSSGIDWFDLEGALDFGDGFEALLPELLEAADKGQGWVNLRDGTLGLLPPGWLERWAVLGKLSKLGKETKSLRFGRGQALILHSLLRDDDEVQVDELFTRIRAKLRSFDRLEKVEAPAGFRGELRPYQQLGVAWLELLEDLQLGGCLADDMGLGKTVQVLAWMLRRRGRLPAPTQEKGKKRGRKPATKSGNGVHLLVVPKSLVFNWAAEIERFTPELKSATLHGSSRDAVYAELSNVDVVITTYGTLARDIDKLSAFTFDTVVLDEAQAIKNRNTQTAEACSALRASHRLALTGTPVENHLGELWSIFDFLNPGLLGHLPRISEYAGRKSLPAEALADVAQALRPLILRRKKKDVLQDLPAKTEQTLICELSASERKRYDGLRTFYQASLKKKIAEVGMSKAKIWVLEALLRLRQAACHIGLVDKKAASQSSAKLDLLLENLEQVLEEGHKAIVFSQFTSLLAICRRQLDARNLRYEYLDGKTRDREARVQRFQNDPEQRLFLISLKAGGVGLNLTAASYVFLLDPWWNPAVESQAIDRAHRIGQSQPVFAYRIIAKDTVEEKILQLQESKRALADAIVAEDQRVLKQLSAADLEALLG